MECRLCRSNNLDRVRRRGFLGKYLLPRFGFYPWQCDICGYVSLFRQRRHGKTEQGQAVDTALQSASRRSA